MKIKSTFNRLLLLVICVVSPGLLMAQMVGANGYIKATNVEVGICGIGGFEGVPTATSPPLPGMHPRSSTGFFGFVANPQLDGWATFDGDFFTPGSPENGWGFEIGTTGGPFAGNNCSYLQQINGAMTGYSHTFDCYNVDWGGSYTSGTDLHFHINYFLQETDLFYTTTVSITNNTSSTITDLFYYRNVDPDNNEEFGGEFPTTNTVVSEPGSSTCDLAHVKATSPLPASQPMSYLGFAGIGNNFRVGHGGFSNRDGSDMWNGVGFVETVGTATYADEAEYISYKIPSLAPGATETFKYVVILDDAAAAAAINNLLYLLYPGSLAAPPAACTPFTDTVRTCGAPVSIGVNGSVVSDFTWSWSPSTGLSATTGPTVVANPGTTTTYVVSGTPTSACVAPVSLSIVVEVTPPGGAPPVIAPVPTVCISNSPFNLTVDSTGGVWSGLGITNTTNGTFDPSIGVGTYMITYVTPELCNNFDTVLITVNGADATITPPPFMCANAAPVTITAASGGGVWSGAGINPGTGVFDPSVAGAGTWPIIYTLSGVCNTADTVNVVVGSVVTPTTGFSYTSPVCISAGINPDTNVVAGFTTGGTFNATGGLPINPTSGTINIATAVPGTYTINYTVPATVCGPAGTSSTTITINPVIMPVTGISYNTPVCITDTNEVPVPAAGLTAGGTYTATPAGLSIDPTTGVINVGVSTPGTYTITYTVVGSNALCTGSGNSTSTITINPLPTITTSANTTVYLGETTTIWANGGTSYNWTNPQDLSCSSCDTTAVNAPATTTYCVTVTNLGCVDSACVKISVEIPCPSNRNLTIPNAFSPNGDGVNDKFCLEGWDDCVTAFTVMIFDRWGEKVFEANTPNFCWDGTYKGKALDPAVFVYFMKATYLSTGPAYADPKGTFDVNRKGNISLIK